MASGEITIDMQLSIEINRYKPNIIKDGFNTI
jgi:hypothetical protein